MNIGGGVKITSSGDDRPVISLYGYSDLSEWISDIAEGLVNDYEGASFEPQDVWLKFPPRFPIAVRVLRGGNKAPSYSAVMQALKASDKRMVGNATWIDINVQMKQVMIDLS